MDARTVGLWRQYNQLVAALGSTSNVVGEFAERLIADHLDGTLLTASAKSADIELPDGRLIQVEARVIRDGVPATSLGIIRTWDFHVLAAVLFYPDGSVLRAVLVPVDAAKTCARTNGLQNGWVIVTTKAFLDHEQAEDITDVLNQLLADGPAGAE